MKMTPRLVLLAPVFLALALPTHAAESGSNIDQSAAQPDQIPIKIDVGFGLSRYKIAEAYTGKDTSIYGTELSIQGVVGNEVIKRYQDRIPKKYRKGATKLGEISVTHIAIPKTVYIHPSDGDKSAFGATWGLVPEVSFGNRRFHVALGGGIIATYMYIHDEKLNDTVNFIRPGVRGVLSVEFAPSVEYFSIEAGVKQDAYVPQKMFGAESAWHFKGAYVMLHFRFPTSVDAP